MSRQSIVQWIIFNYLISNNDAHAKNISLIIIPKALQIAPWYDLFCVKAYLSESVMAMTINDQVKPGMLLNTEWSALAKLSGIPTRLMDEYIEAQAQNIEDHSLKIKDYPEFTNDER